MRALSPFLWNFWGAGDELYRWVCITGTWSLRRGKPPETQTDFWSFAEIWPHAVMLLMICLGISIKMMVCTTKCCGEAAKKTLIQWFTLKLCDWHCKAHHLSSRCVHVSSPKQGIMEVLPQALLWYCWEWGRVEASYVWLSITGLFVSLRFSILGVWGVWHPWRQSLNRSRLLALTLA